MIEGLHLDIASSELREHLEKRVQHHLARAEQYAKQAKEFEDEQPSDGAAAFKNTANSPLDSLKSSAKNHKHRASKFAFMSKHLVQSETYRLTVHELQELELISAAY